MVSVGELGDVNYAEILPFHSLNDYNVENEILSTRRKFVNLMDNEKFENLLKDNMSMNLFSTPASCSPVSILTRMNLMKQIETMVNV